MTQPHSDHQPGGPRNSCRRLAARAGLALLTAWTSAWTGIAHAAEPAKIPLSVLTYNTHMFGDLAKYNLLTEASDAKDAVLGNLIKKDIPKLVFKDDERKQALKEYLGTRPADIVLLQEVWSGAFANNLKHAPAQEIYRSFFALNPHHGGAGKTITRILKNPFKGSSYTSVMKDGVNTSGLAILAVRGIELEPETAHFHSFKDDYTSGEKPDLQDQWENKGWISMDGRITSEYHRDIPDRQPLRIRVYVTHNLTSHSKIPKTTANIYQVITDDIAKYRSSTPDAMVIFGGDLNDSYPQGTPPDKTDQFRYTNWIRPSFLAVGMTNAMETWRVSNQTNQVAYSVNADKNRLLKHFTPDNTRKECPDHIFYGGSQDGAVAVTLTDLDVLDNEPALRVSERYDVSDHYAMRTTFVISGSRLRSNPYKYDWKPVARLLAHHSSDSTEVDANLFKGLWQPSGKNEPSLNSRGRFVTGFGARVIDNNFEAAWLKVADVDANGKLQSSKTWDFGDERSMEAIGTVGPQEVLVGLGMRVHKSNLTTLKLYGRRLDPDTGKLTGPIKEHKFGSSPDHKVEMVWISPETDTQTIITGVGAQAKGNNMKSLVVYTGKIVAP